LVVDSGEEFVKVLAGELAVERRGDLLVVAREREQALLDSVEV
jgi:hypothetical protein